MSGPALYSTGLALYTVQYRSGHALYSTGLALTLLLPWGRGGQGAGMGGGAGGGQGTGNGKDGRGFQGPLKVQGGCGCSGG